MTRRERASAEALGWITDMREALCDLEAAVDEIRVNPRLDPGLRGRADEAAHFAAETGTILDDLEGELRAHDHVMQVIAMLAVTGKRTDHVKRRSRELRVPIELGDLAASAAD